MEEQKNITKEEKLSVLAVLNDFSETFKIEAKARMELRNKVEQLLESKKTVSADPESKALFEKEINTQLDLQKIKLDSIFNYIQKNNLPVEEILKLKRAIAEQQMALQHPPSATVVHHHHLHKIIIATIGLALLALLLGYQLLVTSNKLDDYIASDSKYRYLKLDMKEKTPTMYLHRLDSLYEANPKLRDSVIAKEKENNRNMELLIEAYNKTREADRLRSEAEKLRKDARR